MVTIYLNKIDKEDSMKLYIVRHGQTLFNYLERVQGWSDSPLTDLGIRQGNIVADHLSSVSFDRVYSSDLNRAIDTANFIIEKQEDSSLVLEQTPLLREAYYGSFEGGSEEGPWGPVFDTFGYDRSLILTDFNQVYREVLATHSNEAIRNIIAENDPMQLTENYADYSGRIKRFIDEITEDNESENILVVNHGGTVQLLIELLLEDSTGYTETYNSSTTIIEIHPDGNSMVDFNNISYFQEDDIS